MSEPARSGGVCPFPWESLDVVSRRDAAATRALRRWTEQLARTTLLAEAFSSLLGARVQVLAKRVRSEASPPRSWGEGVAVVLAACDAPVIARAALVEAEASLVATVVARALRRSLPSIVAPNAGSGAMAGAMAAIVAAAARRAHAGRALRVLVAGPAQALSRDFVAANGEVIEAILTVVVDDEAHAARVLVPCAVASTAPDAAWTRASLAALGDARLALPLVAAVSRSSAAELGSLRRGDIWLPAGWSLRPGPGGRLTGPVVLASPFEEAGVRATLGDDGRLVLGGELQDLGWLGEVNVADTDDTGRDALIDAVGEVPVVVRVEIGLAEMRAREWAALGPGDVIALGSRIGEPVTLRVGGAAVARGELVDLDGEMGVRILGRGGA